MIQEFPPIQAEHTEKIVMKMLIAIVIFGISFYLDVAGACLSMICLLITHKRHYLESEISEP